MSDNVRDEFLAEAQEIIESLSRDLLLLDQAQKDAGGDPDLVNEVFRGVHTLKGIAGMFGYHQLGAVAHALEDLLDDLRLGRVALSQEVLDVLFEGVENFQRLLIDAPDTVDLEAFAAEIDRVSSRKAAPQGDPLEEFELDEVAGQMPESLPLGIRQRLQLAVATSIMASKGLRRVPRLVQSIDGVPVDVPALEPIVAPPEYWQAVHKGMVEVVHGQRGTAKALAVGLEYQMAGKTGTAQVIGIAQGAVYNEADVSERHRHHGLFIAFAPAQEPTIAVAIIVENGGGSSAAYPIARQVIDTWLFGEAD